MEIEDRGRAVPVDTGFIVYNERNYPNLVRLFDTLGVATEPSDMSFSVSTEGGAFEYRARALGMLAQPSNLLRPSYRRMLREIVRFSREAKALVGREPDESTGEWLEHAGYSSAFRDDFLLPMVGVHLVLEPAPDALLPGSDDGRLPRQPRTARSREPPAVAHGDGREPRVRASGRRCVRRRPHRDRRSIRWCANPTRCWSATDGDARNDSTTWSSPRTPTPP